MYMAGLRQLTVCRHAAALLTLLLALALAAHGMPDIQQQDVGGGVAPLQTAVTLPEAPGALLLLWEQDVQRPPQQQLQQQPQLPPQPPPPQQPPLPQQQPHQQDANRTAESSRSLLQVASLRVAWRGRMDVRYQLSYFAPYIVYSSSPAWSLKKVAYDPTNISSRQPVLRATYPKGSLTPGSKVPGGFLFYVYPFGKGVPLAYVGATLEFDVYFPDDFDFVKGGKLLGLAGGPVGCGGGVNPTSCWSVRIMWRRRGAGEAYMYVPEGHQGADFCSQKPYTECNYAYGVSLSRGAFSFTPGKWHRIGLTVRMNKVGQANGIVEVTLNGNRVIYYDKVAYRTKPGIQVDSIYFNTFFGGSDETWSPPADTYTLFKNVCLYRADPPSGRSIVSTAVLSQPIAITLPLQDIEPAY